MVSCPDSLVWEVTKRNHSFLKKRNGKSKRSGKVEFSSEKGNLKSLNQFKYSGFANSKVFNVASVEVNGKHKAVLIKKNATKAATNPSKTNTAIRINRADFRRGVRVIKNRTSKVFYRRDLEAAALGKWTKVYQANKRANGIKKGVPCKMGRGTN